MSCYGFLSCKMNQVHLENNKNTQLYIGGYYFAHKNNPDSIPTNSLVEFEHFPTALCILLTSQNTRTRLDNSIKRGEELDQAGMNERRKCL